MDLGVAALVFDDPNHRSEQDRFVNGEERSVRGKFYRPEKEIVSICLDKDILAFFKSQGASYQTRINDSLRSLMQAALLEKRKMRR